MKQINNNTINNKCSRCGECCGLFIPFTKKELKRIKEYVKEHNIKPYPRINDNNMYASCCFFNREEHKCTIYEVRPFVCKNFLCSHRDWLQRRNKYEQHGDYNSTIKNKVIVATFDDLIYGDCEPIIRYLISVMNNPNDTNELIYILKKVNRLDLLDRMKLYDENDNLITKESILNEYNEKHKS